MSYVYSYIGALAEHWLWLVGAVVITNLDVLKFLLSDRAWQKLEAWLPSLRTKWRVRLLVGLVFIAGWLAWIDERKVKDEFANTAKTAIGQVAQLNKELDVRKDRAALKAQLQALYAEGSQITGFGVKNEADFEKFKAEMAPWKEKTRTWVKSNMTEAAAEFFQNTKQRNQLVPFAGAISLDHIWYVSEMEWLRDNVKMLISDERFDRPQ